jgi:hypothetical protein
MKQRGHVGLDAGGEQAHESVVATELGDVVDQAGGLNGPAAPTRSPRPQRPYDGSAEGAGHPIERRVSAAVAAVNLRLVEKDSASIFSRSGVAGVGRSCLLTRDDVVSD